MSRINVDALHSEDGASSNIELDDSRNATCKGNLTVDGTTTLTGAVTLPAGTTSDTLSFRNLVINGSCIVAQRATTYNDVGYETVDRFKVGWNGTNENGTQSQHSLTSSDTGPWEKGFRKCLRVQNGNQTSGAGADDEMNIFYQFEAQDIANSGWNYTSSSSKITLQFWVRSSVAQNFYGYLRSIDGTQRAYAFETGSLSANTWTKVTKTIPGDSSLQFDDNNALGFQIVWYPFVGTNLTTSGRALNTWINNDDANRVPDATSTWWTTNDATFDLTGVQLEVGDTATDFEHRSYADELSRCHRYCQMDSATTSGHQWHMYGFGYAAGATYSYFNVELHTPMRAVPSLVEKGLDDGGTSSSGNGAYIEHASSTGMSTYAVTSASVNAASTPQRIMVYVGHDSATQGHPVGLKSWNNQTSYLLLEAEL